MFRLKLLLIGAAIVGILLFGLFKSWLIIPAWVVMAAVTIAFVGLFWGLRK